MADPTTGSGRRFWRAIVPVLIILGGLVILLAFKATRKPPEKGRERAVGALVETIEVEPGRRHIMIETHGTVVPRYELALVPQVQGKVAWAHPDLVAGSTFGEGDTLVRIEDADYVLAVQRAAAQVAQAELAIEIERAQADVAHREWVLMTRSRERLMGLRAGSDNPLEAGTPSGQPGETPPDQPTGTAGTPPPDRLTGTAGTPPPGSPPRGPDPLVLREPQLEQAEANLGSAQAAMAAAELNLARTVLRAPFDCRVRRQNVAPGQFVGPGTTIASLYNTDLAEIEVGISLANLAWIEIPGADATVTLDTGEDEHRWEGYVHRSVGVLDELGRLARVIVRVQDPFGLQPSTQAQSGQTRGSRADLNIGSFVTVLLRGREVIDALPIPRQALHENNTVWVMNERDELEIRTVSVKHMTGQEALIATGLWAGERVVTSPLAGPVPGMQLRLVDAKPQP